MGFGKKQGGAHEANAAQKVHKPKKQLTKKEKNRRILVAALVIVAALLCMVVAVTAFFQRPELPNNGDKDDEFGSDFELIGPKLDGDRKKDFFTFLIIGRDTGGGGNTDTVLLAAYDIPNQKMNVMSIPRDTMVNVSWDVKKINSVYNFNGGGDKGIKALYKEVSELVGFVPDYNVVVEWEAVGELVDAIGGVWFDVPRDMDYEDPAQDLSIHVKRGYQLLDGEDAMGVVRFREGKNGYATGDLGRIETQQAFLKALIEQCLKIDKMTKVMEYARIFTQQVTTDLTVNNLAWFAQKAIFGGLTSENISFITMPYDTRSVWSRSYHQRLSYVVPKVDELIEVVNTNFNPYQDALTSDELDIMFVNSNGTIGCTSGRLQDTKANTAVAQKQQKPITPTKPEKPPVDISKPENPEKPPVDMNKPTVPETPVDPSVDPEIPPEGPETGGESPETTDPIDPNGSGAKPTVPEGGNPVNPGSGTGAAEGKTEETNVPAQNAA